MALYQDPTTKQITEISSPELNPELVKGKTQVSSAIPVDTLNSSPSPLNVSTPSISSIYPVSSLNTDTTTQLQPTSPEIKAQDATTELQKLNEMLLGQSAFRSQQETVQGIPELQKTQTDLSSRLKAIQNEALAIPQQLQIEATGRGITAGGLQPIQTERLRANAIAALGVSSLLEASRGNLTLANDLVDRAVAQKYDPIKEEIAVKTANLDLILKSPEYSLADKNRAQAQKDIQDRKAAEITKKAEDDKQKGVIAIEAAKNGATSTILQSIQNAKDSNEALRIGAEAGFVAPKAKPNLEIVKLGDGNTIIVDKNTGKQVANLGGGGASSSKILSVNEAQALGVPYGTTEAQAIALGKTPQKPATATQETTALYANRIEQSNAILSKLDEVARTLNPVSYAVQSNLPQVANILKSGDFQSIEQAQRNFVNAVLRRESGAVISPSEFENAQRQYFAQPGDTIDVVAQKKANRDLVMKGFIDGAGGAYSPLPSTLSGSDTYASFRAQLQPGEILVNRNGKATAITPNELQATDIKL